MINDYLAKECSLSQLTFQTDAMLAPHSTFGIGGQADYIVKPLCEDALIRLIDFLKKNGIRYGVFGNGSNLLFDDAGYRGVVILTTGLKNYRITETVIEAECGTSLIGLSALATREGLSGLEFACGIPGSLGGAVYMNAGAHGGEMSDVVLSVRYLDSEGTVRETTSHGFSYRHSFYQDRDYIILSCKMGLRFGDREEILRKVAANKEKRESTQPTRERSAGSVFRRSDGIIPAALIDRAGLKGLSVGGAQVSRKHAGFIVNTGNATACDVITLINLISEKIYSLYQIQLTPEIRLISER